MGETKWVEEAEFAARMARGLRDIPVKPDFVTGPGRSGAVAAVYASYVLGVPFVPWKAAPDMMARRVLVVDTASMSGATIRKAMSFYSRLYDHSDSFVAFDEREKRHHFWFERVSRVGGDA